MKIFKWYKRAAVGKGVSLSAANKISELYRVYHKKYIFANKFLKMIFL